MYSSHVLEGGGGGIERCEDKFNVRLFPYEFSFRNKARKFSDETSTQRYLLSSSLSWKNYQKSLICGNRTVLQKTLMKEIQF